MRPQLVFLSILSNQYMHIPDGYLSPATARRNVYLDVALLDAAACAACARR